MKLAVPIFILTLLLCLNPIGVAAEEQARKNISKEDFGWQKLAPGLDLGIFRAPLPSEIGDSKIRVLRIDPQRYKFRLLSASAFENGRALSAKQWTQQNGLVAAINASMYQEDYKSSVSLMRSGAHINNPRLSKDMTILAFDSKSPEVPLVKIIDRQCEDFRIWQKKYRAMVQSIRMISCT